MVSPCAVLSVSYRSVWSLGVRARIVAWIPLGMAWPTPSVGSPFGWVALDLTGPHGVRCSRRSQGLGGLGCVWCGLTGSDSSAPGTEVLGFLPRRVRASSMARCAVRAVQTGCRSWVQSRMKASGDGWPSSAARRVRSLRCLSVAPFGGRVVT